MEQLNDQFNSSSEKSPFLPIVISVIITTAFVSGIFWWIQKEKDPTNHEVLSPSSQSSQTQTPSTTNESSTLISDSLTQAELESYFKFDTKQPGTKIYYSDKLGVGFTYLLERLNPSFKITEAGNIIDVMSQTIEVFEKDPKLSLKEAIEDRFLKDYNPTECFVEIYQPQIPRDPEYISAGISYPRSNNSTDSPWQNGDKCPSGYSETNGVQYFLMNKEVPGKFLFVKIGQDAVALDGGTVETEGAIFGWDQSIRILK